MEYQHGKLNASDVLSRSPFHDNNSKLSHLTEEYIYLVCQNSVPCAVTLDDIDRECGQDPDIKELITCIQHEKWPILIWYPYLRMYIEGEEKQGS